MVKYHIVYSNILHTFVDTISHIALETGGYKNITLCFLFKTQNRYLLHYTLLAILIEINWLETNLGSISLFFCTIKSIGTRISYSQTFRMLVTINKWIFYLQPLLNLFLKNAKIKSLMSLIKLFAIFMCLFYDARINFTIFTINFIANDPKL